MEPSGAKELPLNAPGGKAELEESHTANAPHAETQGSLE